LERLLGYLFDENEFLSPTASGLCRVITQRIPYFLQVEGQEFRVGYVPGESDSWLFGGNSNWRGPIWFPDQLSHRGSVGALLLFYGESFRVEFPAGSGNKISLKAAAREIGSRLCALFLTDQNGVRPCLGPDGRGKRDPSLVLFHEYFHADSGEGLGASHQTGWTALITRLLAERVKVRRRTHLPD